MAAIAQLKALLHLDDQQFKAGMRGSVGAAGKLQSQLASVGRTLGAAFSVGAIVAATKRTIEFACQVRHASDNLEISTESYQGLTAAALKYGSSQEAVATALGKIKDSQGKVIAGDKEYIDSLDALNISAEKFSKVGADKALEMIAKGYATATDRAAAFESVSALAGRQGKNLTAFLKELAEVGLQGVIDKGTEAGHVMGDQFVTDLEKAGTAIEQFQRKATIFWGGMLVASQDYMQMAKESTKSWQGLKNIVSEGMRFTSKAIPVLGPKVGRFVDKMFPESGLQRHIDEKAGLYDGEGVNDGKTYGDMLREGSSATGAAGAESIEKKAAEKSSKAIDKLKDEVSKMQLDRLDGEKRIAAELAITERKIAEQLKTEQGQAMEWLLNEKLSLAREAAAKEIAIIQEQYNEESRIKQQAMEEERQNKANRMADIEQRARDGMAAGKDQFGEFKRTATGRGMTPSALNAIGGFQGGERGYLGQADRQLKIEMEGNRVRQEMKQILAEMQRDLATVAEET